MASLKKWLDEAGFDWDDGILILAVSEGKNRLASPDDGLVLGEFCSGYGVPECPSFVAFDRKAIYFPEQYDGSTSLVAVYRDSKRYLDGEKLPYPGGG